MDSIAKRRPGIWDSRIWDNRYLLKQITVHGARQHNLKNIDVAIPRNTLTVITGLSGSGKSSLAFDTIYAEGQRRYVETLSPYARQFLDQMERPEVDSIDGLSPAISIEQKTTSRSPRSTVGTITEIYDYLRVLYAAIGVPHCPTCGLEISRQSAQQILQQVMTLGPQERVMILAPIVRGRKGEYRKELEKLARQGFVRARVDGVLRPLDEEITLDKRKNHTIEVVVDRLLIKPEVEKRLEASIETATKLAGGLVLVAQVDGPERLYSQKLACPECGSSVPQLEPRSFSFNSPFGACETCTGLGSRWNWDPAKVIVDPSKPLLDGALGIGGSSTYVNGDLKLLAARLKIPIQKPFEKLPKKAQQALSDGLIAALDQYYEQEDVIGKHARVAAAISIGCDVPGLPREALKPSSLAVKVKGVGIAELTGLSVTRALETVKKWKLAGREEQIGKRPVDEVRNRLGISGGRGTRVSEPGAFGGDAVGRRSAAHPAGHADRLEAARGFVCARRAVDRAAFARQRPACSIRCKACGIWATRCWWWSTMPRPSSAPIT